MASLFHKADPYHGQHGKFTFGSNGDQRPARPVGPGGKVNALLSDRASSSDRWTLGGSIVGDLASDVGTRYAIAGMGADVGGLLGPEGRLIGGIAGQTAAWMAPKTVPILAGIAGSFLGAKIGNALYDLKQRVSGAAIMQSAYDAHAGLSARQTAGEAGSVVGGAGTYAAARLSGAEPMVSGKLGETIGALFGRPTLGEAAGETIGAAAASLPGDVLGYRLGTKAYDAGGGQRGKPGASRPEAHELRVAGRVARQAIRKAAAAAPKPMLDAHPQFDGTYASLTRTAPQFLFGTKQWREIKGTPFGNFLQLKLDDTAETLDEANAQITPTPMQLFSTVEQQQPSVPPPPAAPGASGQTQPQPPQPGDFGKSIGFAYPNDANVSMFNSAEGPAKGVRYLRRMQAADAANSLAQIRRVLAQARVENLQPQPSEDERQYRARVQGLFRQGIDGVPVRLYKVNLPVPKVRDGEEEASFEIKTQFDKALNTEGSLQKGLVYGWASVIEKDGNTVVDHDKDWTTEEELTKAAHDYITHRTGGVLHDEKGKQIGEIVESLVFSKDLQKALGIDLKKVGWLIGYQIHDNRVRALAQKGLLKSFSIGGAGKRTPQAPPNEGVS
jgi:hypothetical protein